LFEKGFEILSRLVPSCFGVLAVCSSFVSFWPKLQFFFPFFQDILKKKTKKSEKEKRKENAIINKSSTSCFEKRKKEEKIQDMKI
jgi:hypothetical protein